MTSGQDPIADSLTGLGGFPVDPRLSLLFPGQGSQKVGMGLEVWRSCPASRKVYEAADRALQIDLSRLCFDGPDEELTRTVNAQPAILVTSLAYLVAALESGALYHRPGYLAGHSLGEYTALVVAGSITFEDAVRLVRERGRLMEKAGAENAGTMAAIVGLTADQVTTVCRLSGAEPCNFNARTQIVVGGRPDAVERACALAKEEGGRGLPMNVAGAFHTALMEPAAQEFHQALSGVLFADPTTPVVGNVTASAMTSGAECMSDLGRQIAMPVLWHQSMLLMHEAGVRTFCELGPGRALTTMLRRDAPDATLISLDGRTVVGSATNV